MVNSLRLSNELLNPIVSHLRDRRIDHSDPVATKDLQSVRLISSRMLAIATPMLFENMVYNLKLYRPQDLNRYTATTTPFSITLKRESSRLAEFAQISPGLVRHVHRLQVKISPVIDPTWPGHPPEVEHLSAQPRGLGMRNRDLWTQAQATKVYEALAHPEQLWSCRQASIWQKVEPHTSATHEIINVLSNLRHLENGLSAYYQQELAEIQHELFTCDGISVQPHYMTEGFLERQVSTFAFDIIINNTTKILKVSIYASPEAAMIPECLQHLDLEFRTRRYGEEGLSLYGMEVEDEARRAEVMSKALWCQSLRRLRQPNALRLGLHYGGGRGTEYGKD